MNRVRKIVTGVVLLCICAAVIYLVIARYYSKGFSVNTWINGVYCTGKAIEDVNLELLDKTKAPSIYIVDPEGKSFILKPEDISLKGDYTFVLKEYLSAQNPFLWVFRLGKQTENLLSPEFTYEEEKLRAFWEDLPFVIEEREKEVQVYIELTEEGYQLKDTTKKRLNEVKAYEFLRSDLQKKLQWSDNTTITDDVMKPKFVIELKGSDFYEDYVLTSQQEAILAEWEMVQTIQSLGIVYDMGDEQIKLTSSDISEFLVRTEDGSFKREEDGSLYISKEKVDAFIDALADEYDTFNKERTFQSTRGDVITLNKGSYGTLIDRDEEKEFLYNALTERVSCLRVPNYKKSAYHRGKNDIGDTYIEIDMTEQKMYLYLDGECLVDTDVVTGCIGKRMGTPEGIYSVYSMQRNRTLRGTGYASFVRYWMPVNGNIGIHDASWRNSFGGEIYKKNGSHGCINTPYEAMKKIFENVEVGIPVVMFY